ncbi:Aldo/keto reductase [Gigaspora margarita]|uniref:Aldo/keto reductase n=1 Tax=Gigaspora margarita TaxID=4874 RepID=A0A8H3X5F4_GIGMA|nr:Aldo/keto reductase [Gigaspora margarita]
MDLRPLTKSQPVSQDKFEVSKILFGTVPFGGAYDEIENCSPFEAVSRALELGINAFDTSPYYGDSEQILGSVLSSLSDKYPRSHYYIITKVGRYGLNKEDFDYSSKRARESVEESCRRLKTDYLDVVYAHDVEFVDIDEVVGDGGILIELFKLKKEGKIKYVGISGYPLDILLKIAAIQYERNQPLDIVQSYSHYCLQNTLLSNYIPKFKSFGVKYLMNASPLSMALLTETAPPQWHPAPTKLRSVISKCASYAKENGFNISKLAIQFSLEWDGTDSTVIGLSNRKQVEEAIALFNEILARKRCEKNADKIEQIIVQEIQKIMGDWLNWCWESPPTTISSAPNHKSVQH